MKTLLEKIQALDIADSIELAENLSESVRRNRLASKSMTRKKLNLITAYA